MSRHGFPSLTAELREAGSKTFSEVVESAFKLGNTIVHLFYFLRFYGCWAIVLDALHRSVSID
jgi:hypothetical protein